MEQELRDSLKLDSFLARRKQDRSPAWINLPWHVCATTRCLRALTNHRLKMAMVKIPRGARSRLQLGAQFKKRSLVN